jgi:integrase/recombinase XerD
VPSQRKAKQCFGRDMQTAGRARATIARRLCTIAGFYRSAVEEELLDHSPAVHVRRPRLNYESHAVGLDRNEVGALLVAAGLGTAAEHALISLLAINGLRTSEALGADIGQLGIERGHRTLTVLRKGGKIVTIPLAPRTARAIDLAVGERLTGPIFLPGDGQRMDRHAAGGIMRRVAKRAGLEKKISTHAAARVHHRRPGRRRPAPRCARSRQPRRRAPPCATDRARVSLDRHATYIVAPTSPEPPANHSVPGDRPRQPRRGRRPRSSARSARVLAGPLHV